MPRKDTGFTLAELNERYKDKPTSKAVYEVDGQRYAVTSHFVGEKDLDKVLYELAFKRAFQKKELKSFEKRLAIFGFLRYNSCIIEYGLL